MLCLEDGASIIDEQINKFLTDFARICTYSTFSLSTTSGSLIFLPFAQPGKQAQKAPTWNASGRPIIDFDTSYIEPLIAATSEDGRISISHLPDPNNLDPSTTLNLSNVASFSAHAQGAPVDIVQFHPTSSGLILTNQGSSLQVWDYPKGGDASALYTATGPQKGHWSASWSRDGRFIQTAGKDNTINLWDIRQSADKPSTVSWCSLHTIECTRVCHPTPNFRRELLIVIISDQSVTLWVI